LRTLIDARFRDEAKRFTLRFTCPNCAHFEAEREACANGYPNRAHLGVDLEADATLEFCKEFELV
jgi:acetone carboxylase gamma subunit